MSLYTDLVQVEKGNRNSLLEGLATISKFDCDFTGENGIEYAWKETLENGFTSNLEYLLNEVKDIKSDNDVVREFIQSWMDMDADYYNEYSFDTVTDNDGNVLVITLAVTTVF